MLALVVRQYDTNLSVQGYLAHTRAPPPRTIFLTAPGSGKVRKSNGSCENRFSQKLVQLEPNENYYTDASTLLVKIIMCCDRLRVALGGVPREKKMSKGHLPRVIHHQVYKYTETKSCIQVYNVYEEKSG